MDGFLRAYTTPLIGCSVNFFTDLGQAKYWVRAIVTVPATSPTFGFFLLSHARQGRVSIFGMPTWHPTNESKLARDALLAAQIDVYVLQLCLHSVGNSVIQSFDNKNCSHM
jgi:hypothetical protein